MRTLEYFDNMRQGSTAQTEARVVLHQNQAELNHSGGNIRADQCNTLADFATKYERFVQIAVQ